MSDTRGRLMLAGLLLVALAACAPTPQVEQCEPGVSGLSDLATVAPPAC